MSTPGTILPPSASRLERAIDQAGAQRLAALPSLVPSLWNADTCPPALLPYLAWALSVDEWDNTWSVDRKRAVIREAREIHETKGTPAAIRRALSAVGQPDAEIIERADYVIRNGSVLRDGTRRRSGPAGWATYRVILKRPVTVDQAYQIKRILLASQRNCVHLVGITYPQSAIRHNGQVSRNGTYTRGSVNTELN